MKKLIALLCICLMLGGCALIADESTLSGEELVMALAFPAEDLAQMSDEQKTAYIGACLELEIMNGGLCQFFANCPECANGVPAALAELGAEEHLALYEAFLADTGIDPLDPMFRTEDLEEFSRLYDLYPWEDFDEPYCELTPMAQLLEDYVAAHPEAFK